MVVDAPKVTTTQKKVKGTTSAGAPVVSGGLVRDDRCEEGSRLPLFKAARRTSPLMQPFKLNPSERNALVAFLRAL